MSSLLLQIPGLFSLGSILILIKILNSNYAIKANKQIGGATNKMPLEIKNTSLSIIVPTYNEEHNIENCLKNIFLSSNPCKDWKVILIDDESTDKTIHRARGIIKKLNISKSRYEIRKAGIRPKDKKWVGKNWACYVATKNLESEWFLFIDADVIVNKDAIKYSINKSVEENIALLSLAPKVNCNCLAEWIVQPIIGLLLGIGFPIDEINDDNNKKAFAAGPFMLFNKTAYHKIGGHKGVHDKVVEDIALAKKIKSNKQKLRFLLGINLLELNMYQNFSSLWEGWSKNWFIGLDRDIIKSSIGSIFVLTCFSLPWLLLIYSSIEIITKLDIQYLYIIINSIVCISLHYYLRSWANNYFKLSTKYWWLMGLGGLIVSSIGPISTIKTLTGWGWTWKGRSLS